MKLKVECPFCGKIIEDDYYASGKCSGCGKEYVWDYVLTDENEEIFDGFYFDGLMAKIVE